MTFASFVYQFSDIINGIIAALAGIAILVFFIGLMKFMFQVSQGGRDAAKQGREFMLWGLIALFVLFALGGILDFLSFDIFGRTSLTGGSQPTGTPNNAFPTPSMNTGVQTTDSNGAFPTPSLDTGTQTNGPSGAF